MKTDANTGEMWVIIEIQRRRFAVAVNHLIQILTAPAVTAVPGLPEFVRGVITLRGAVMPLVDLRSRLGIPPAAEEIAALCRLLDAREGDHRRWLGELRNSALERRPFSLTTDPHHCAFGKWYDRYRAEDPWVANFLKRFDDPHRRIHALAAQVKALQDTGRFEEAIQLVTVTGSATLAEMIDLFTGLKQMLNRRAPNQVLAMACGGRHLALAVDAAIAVEKLRLEDMPAGIEPPVGGVVRRLGRRAAGGEIVLIVEPDRILDWDHFDQAASRDTGSFGTKLPLDRLQ